MISFGAHLLNRRKAREIALEACQSFGIPATRISPAFLDDMEVHCMRYIAGAAVAAVPDGHRTIGWMSAGKAATPQTAATILAAASEPGTKATV